MKELQCFGVLKFVRMKQFWLFIFSVPLFGQPLVSNRYIVELSQDPVAAHAGVRRAAALHSTAAEAQRARVRTQQSTARTAIESLQGMVIGQVENVGNALMVRIADSKASSL